MNVLTPRTGPSCKPSANLTTRPMAAMAIPCQKPTFRHLAAGFFAAFALLIFGALTASAHESPAGCTGSGLGIDLFANFGDVHIGDTIRYSARIFNSPFPACDATGITALVVTPDGHTNDITPLLVRNFLSPGQSDFYTNVVTYVVRAQDLLPDGTVRATALDKGTIHQNDTDSHGGGNQGVNTEVNLPCVSISALCLGGVGENGAIRFSGTVTNCGNNTLVGVAITNFVNNGFFSVLFPTNLAIGQSANFSGSWVPSNPCAPSVAVLTVVATDQFTATPRTISSFTTLSCQNTVTPGIHVTKTCPVLPVAPGQLLTFSGTVSNTGDITLTDIVVLNSWPVLNTPVFTLASLAPGATANFTGSYLAPTNCSVTDTLTASASSVCGAPVSSTATATCAITTTPMIAVNLSCPTNAVLQGSLLSYSGVVSNIGGTTLSNVVVISDRPSANTVVFTASVLVAGESATFSGSYQVPTNCCVVTSTVVAHGQDCSGKTASDEFSKTCNVLTLPKLSIIKICPVEILRPGDLLAFSGAISNSGNITLINVTVVNSESTNHVPILGPITLAPGESFAYNSSYIVSKDFCGTDTVTAMGLNVCNMLPVSSSVTTTCPVVTPPPRIAITKNCPISPTPRGGIYSFTGTVRNPGEVTLLNVMVVNNLPTNNTPVFGPITLAPGQSVQYSGQFIAPMDCCEIIDTVTATGQAACSSLPAIATSTDVCPLLNNPRIGLVEICPANPIPMGSIYAFHGFVTNTGDINLTNVFVFGPQGTNFPVLGPIELAPGESKPYAGTYTVQTGVCSVSVSAVGQDTCGGRTSTNTMGCPVATVTQIAVTANCPTSPLIPGMPATYSGSVRNGGNVFLSNVAVLNNLTGSTPVFTLASLAPGVSANFTGSFLVPTNCSVVNALTATGGGSCGDSVTNTTQSICPIVTTPQIAVAVLCPTTPILPGSLLTYSGSIRNLGNVTLTNVAVVSDRPLPNTTVFTVASLAPGASTNFTSSITVPANICSVVKIFSVTGKDLCSLSNVTNSASAICNVVTSPSIAVTESCPTTPPVPGSLLTYTGSVRNSGDVSLANVVVLNSLTGTTPVFTLASLAPGATAPFTGSFLVPTNCSVSSSLTASGLGSCGVSVTNTAQSVCPIHTAPQIAVAALCPTTPGLPGGLLTYSGTVRNLGNVTLTDVAIVSDRPLPNTTVFTVSSLAPGASTNFTSSITVPANVCSVVTIFSVIGKDLCSLSNVTNSASAICNVVTSPSIAVTQSCPTTPPIPGSLLTYTGTVHNSGDVSLANVVVLNSLTGTTPVFTLASLAPGATAPFTGSFLVPTNCSVSSTLTASGLGSCEVSVTNTAQSLCPILTAPQIAVAALCPTTPTLPGGLLTYSGTVRNLGNVTLTNVAVVSDRPLPNTTVFTVASLAPGASTNFTSSITVPANVCSVITLFTGTAKDLCSLSSVTNAASVTCVTTNNPAIAVSEICPPGPVIPGSVVAFSGVVSNTGDTTLQNVFVFSTHPNTNTPVLGPITLAPGTSAPFTGNYVAVAGSNESTNSTILTNSVSHTTTNIVTVVSTNNTQIITTNGPGTMTFGTIDAPSKTVVDRFPIGTGITGLTYAGEDHGYGATEFYAMRQDSNGNSFFDTIIASTATIIDRFAASNRTFDALTYAAGDLGYGPLQFYYLSHNSAGVSTFGSIAPGGVVGVVSDHFVVGNNFDALTFTATDVGYGANLFYYVRHDASGLSTFGTINPALPGTITDRFTIGTNVDALVFTDLAAPGYGANNFYYLRHDANNVSTFGTIFVTTPTTATVTDRFKVGTNATELTFTATDAGSFGPNLFYFLRAGQSSYTTNVVATLSTNLVTIFTTNSVVTLTTNSVITFTPTNTVLAFGTGLCHTNTVSAAADCLGPVATGFSTPVSNFTVRNAANGLCSISIQLEQGRQVTVQYKDSLNDPNWIDLQTVTGTGTGMLIDDPTASKRSLRFYRVVPAQ